MTRASAQPSLILHTSTLSKYLLINKQEHHSFKINVLSCMLRNQDHLCCWHTMFFRSRPMHQQIGLCRTNCSIKLPAFPRNNLQGGTLRTSGHNSTYFMKSSRDIQKTPSSDPWAISSYLNSGVHRGDASDQSPVHEKRPHGLRRRTSLRGRSINVR